MKNPLIHTRRKTLDTLFSILSKSVVSRPRRGWIAEIRKALGMRSDQLASRLEVTQSALSRLEQSERNDTISLQTLRRVADALNCDLYYTLIPRAPLQDQLLDRAVEVVRQDRERLSSMIVQDPAESESEVALKQLFDAYQLAEQLDRRIWD